MSAKQRSFDLDLAHDAVRMDVHGVLGAFLEGEYEPDRSIGQSTWRSDSSEFFAIRWRFEGRHTRHINGFGHTQIPPTNNHVSVSGLTLVENTKHGQAVSDLDEVLNAGTVKFHRFIDWLAVFAQIGVLHLGRPMAMDDIRFIPPERALSRLPGYNDEQSDT
ncbi:MAG TPA: hypothetical protein VFE86_13590 [Ilumatobacteraceae bacterium]|nr:hypothetical protein [Ilumatobacteraceae bacterium]